MQTSNHKEFRVSVRIYAVERLKALALDSKLIQMLARHRIQIAI